MFKLQMGISLLLVALFFSLTANAFQIKRISKFDSSNVDETFYQAMNSNVDTIIIEKKNSPYVIGPLRFAGIKNKVLIFEKGVVIAARKNAFPKTNDALFKFIDCENIVIQGNSSILKMNKEEYLDGEWRHVIRLRGCKNINISDLTLRDSGGDGIAVGRSEKVWYSKNIRLKNIQCINNKRQGISITSAENVWVSDSSFTETKGTAPGAGLDIEPDAKEERMVNVNFKNCLFENNFYAGINIGLTKVTSTSEKVSVVFENCVIRNNFSPKNTLVAAEIIIKSHKTEPVGGSVTFKECIVENSKWAMLFTRKNEAGFLVTFENCSAKNICTDDTCHSAIYMEVPHYRYASDFGGYHFENLKLDYSRKIPPMSVRGSKIAIYNNFRNVTGKILLANPNESVRPEITYYSYSSFFNENVSLSIEKGN